MTAMPSTYDHLDADNDHIDAEADTVTPPASMLERVTLILDLFDASGRRLPLEEISKRTGLPRSSAHRILEHMTALGWVSRSGAGYGFGSRARWLGRLAGDASALRWSAAPLLHELSMSTGMVAHLAILEGAEIIYLDKVGGRHVTAVPTRVGGRAPAHGTALGKAMLAWLTPEQVEVQLLGRAAPGIHARAELEMLHWELDRIRMRNGLAFERGDGSPTIDCVAICLRGPEGPIGAISLAGSGDFQLDRVAPLLARAARRVTHDLLRVPPTALGQPPAKSGPALRMV